jgi:hypothetical protein
MVQPESAPQGGGLTELAAALGRMNPALDRAMVTRETNRVDTLRRTGNEAQEQIIANEFQGYTAAQIGESLQSEPMAARFAANPYILPALKVHRGRVSADEMAHSMLEAGVNPADPDAVSAYLQENAPQDDDPFFARGMTEQLDRHRAQWTQMQMQSTLREAEGARVSMGGRELLTSFQDSGDWGVALAALYDTPGLDGHEKGQIALDQIRVLANAGDLASAEALANTQRGTAPSLAEDSRTSVEVSTALATARVRWEQNQQDGYVTARDEVRDAINAGMTRASLEADPRFLQLPVEMQSQARGWQGNATAGRVRDARVAENQRRRDAARFDRDNQRDLGERSTIALDNMLETGATLEEIEATDAYGNLGTAQQRAYRRRVRDHNAASPASERATSNAAFTDAASQRILGAQIGESINGNPVSFEPYSEVNPDTGRAVTISTTDQRREFVGALRASILGDAGWNQPEEGRARYREYTNRLRAAGNLPDPQMSARLDAASIYLSPEGAQSMNVPVVKQAFDMYSSVDTWARSAFVTDDNTRAVFEEIARTLTVAPETPFAEAAATAVAARGLQQVRVGPMAVAFTTFERMIDYTLEDPTTGRSVNPPQYRDSSSNRRNDTAQELRQFSQERFLQYRASGIGPTEAATLATHDLQSEFISWNGAPLRLPPNREGGVTSAPAQWARHATLYSEAYADEMGIDAEDVTIRHIENGTYVVSDGTGPGSHTRLIHATMLQDEASLWARHSIPAAQLSAAQAAVTATNPPR